jgi:hypothetical protein
MILKLLLITVILYILVQQILDSTNNVPQEETINHNPVIISSTNYEHDEEINNISEQLFNHPAIIKTSRDYTQKQLVIPSIPNKEKFTNQSNSQKVWEFDDPNPWTKIVFNSHDEYPYYFYIKLIIKSLNDYQTWKQIVPNIDFNPQSGELIIPCKDEPSALALANLIVINITGQLSIEHILNKNLIQISTAKSRKYELVQNKLREQIKENLNKKVNLNMPDSFEKDLANMKQPINITENHFSNQIEYTNDVDAYDGTDFSYL